MYETSSIIIDILVKRIEIQWSDEFSGLIMMRETVVPYLCLVENILVFIHLKLTLSQKCPLST